MVLASRSIWIGAAIVLGLGWTYLPRSAAVVPEKTMDRSPVDVVLGPAGDWLLTVNQTSNSVSLVDLGSGKVSAEIEVGKRPSALALSSDGKLALVSATYDGVVSFLTVKPGTLEKVASLYLGFEPRGLAFSRDGKLAYVALSTDHTVAVVDVDRRSLVQKIAVGRWPRYLAVSPDGKRLAVGINGDGGVAVVDLVEHKKLYSEEFVGLNFGQMQIAADSKHVYVPWMVYRHNPITPGNIRLGWVLASRIAKVKLDGPARRDAFSLDPPGKAIADPHGLALSPDEQWLACAASGTKELLIYRVAGLPFQDYGGTDHIDPKLLKDGERFRRVPLDGRPMAIRFSADGQKVFVANYLLNAVQVVDFASGKIERTLDLGGAREPSLVRRGETIFHDGLRSLDQWYSCHSCHYEGHTNAIAMDTKNDGRFGNFKTVLSLRNVKHTGPYFWHGWEKDLDAALKRSMTDTMLGRLPTDDEVQAVRAYLETLQPAPNPYRTRAGQFTEEARRGEAIFKGDRAGCARCHSGPNFTDGRVHDVGTRTEGDVYKGYNPPSLLGAHDRILYLHDGRSRNLEEALRKHHNPADVTGRGELTDAEWRDLLAYVRSL